jgi:hypothetical protein
MSQQHLCFYSAKCRFCQTFLEELSRSPYSKEFRFVCVDAKPGIGRPQLPSYVKAVPTLMIQGEEQPRTDSSVMNWLSERRLLERDGVPKAGFNTGLGGTSAGPDSGGIAAFSYDMFAGGGDEGFAYIDEVTVDPKAGANVRLASNMVSFDNIHLTQHPDIKPTSNMGLGPSNNGGAPTGRQSGKSKAFEDAFSSFQAARDRDVPGPRGRI